MEAQDQILLFPLVVDSDGWPPVGAEVIPVKSDRRGNFTILTSPFFINNLSVGDVISVQIDEKKAVKNWLHVERSRNSTVWVLKNTAPNENELAKQFLKLQCNVERFSEIGLLSVDVPPHVLERTLDRVIDNCRAIGAHVAVPSFRFDEPTANAN